MTCCIYGQRKKLTRPHNVQPVVLFFVFHLHQRCIFHTWGYPCPVKNISIGRKKEKMRCSWYDMQHSWQLAWSLLWFCDQDRLNLLIMYVINVSAVLLSSRTLLLSALITLPLTQMQSFSPTLFLNVILGAVTVHHASQAAESTHWKSILNVYSSSN